MTSGVRWVLLCYRLPREPSTPRISVWRNLRRLGAVQLGDGLVGLPLDARNREQLEWLADEILEAGGDSSLWLAEATSADQERALAERMAAAVAEEYRGVIAAAGQAHQEDPGQRRRTLARLRRELRRIRSRDYFSPVEAEEAQRAVQALAQELETTP